MAKWIYRRKGGPRLNYRALGFVAEPGDILEADVAPDSRWALHDDQGAVATVRYPVPSATDGEGTLGYSLAQLDADLTELNDVTLPALATDLATLDGLFPITSTSIADDAITTPKLVANCVSADKIVANSIGAGQIAANSIGAGQIVANSIGAGQIAALSITSAEIAADAITASKIAAGTITGSHIGSSTTITTSGNLYATNIYAADDLFTLTTGTTGSAANVRIGSGGRLIEATSSQRYKYDIDDAALDLDAFLSIQPRTFRRYDDEGYDEAHPELGSVYVGLIAEEVDDLGLESMVDRDDQGRPNAIDWPAMQVHLLAVVQQQAAQIAALTARLDALETTR